MSDNSGSRVTVTLGRNGRVVKRAGGLLEEGSRNGVSMTGSKRSIRDRLGGSCNDGNQQYNKRQRGENIGTSSSDDMCLGKDDLRFKLMQKDMVRESRNSESLRNVDLRDKLLRKTAWPSSDSTRHPESNHGTMRHPESNHGTMRHPESNHGTMRRPESAGSTRYPVVEPRDAGRAREAVLQSRDTMGRLPSSRNPSDLSALGPGGAYTSWTLENLRRRSPELVRRRSPELVRRRSPEDLRRRSPELAFRPSAPRGLTPERNREDLQRRQLIRAYDDGRSTSCMRLSPTRAVRSSPFLTNSSLSNGPVKSMVPHAPHYPHASGIMQKMPSTVDEPPSVDGLLQSLGLEKYAIYFMAEEIDMNALRQLGDSDLKDLGIPMGPRKKILQAVMARPRRLP